MPKITSLVGLAVRHDQVNMIKIKKARTGILIENFFKIDLLSPLIQEGRLVDSVQLTDVVRQGVVAMSAENCYAAVSMPAAYVMSRAIKLAAFLTDAERDIEIAGNLAHYLPGMQGQLQFDWVQQAEQENEAQLLLVAARKEWIDVLEKQITLAGLLPRIIDVDCYALARAMDWCSAKEAVHMLLDLDGCHVQWLILQKSHVLYSQQWQVQNDMEVLSYLRQGMKLFNASLQPFQERMMTISGEKSRALAMQSILQNEFEISVANPFAMISLSEEICRDKLLEHAPELMAALGSVLRSFPKW